MKRWSVDARLVVVAVVLALWAGRLLSWHEQYDKGFSEGRLAATSISIKAGDPAVMWVLIDEIAVGEVDTFWVAVTRERPDPY